MIVLILICIVLITIFFIQKYVDNVMSKQQVKVLIFSSFWFIIIYVFLYNILIHQKNPVNLAMNNSLYIPLLFYILWYISCSIIIHRLQVHSGYGSILQKNIKNKMSIRDTEIL